MKPIFHQTTGEMVQVILGLPYETDDLSRLNFRDANLQGADLEGASLTDADLSGAILDFADLRHAKLNGADLRGASLFGARLDGARLFDAMLRSQHELACRLSPASVGSAIHCLVLTLTPLQPPPGFRSPPGIPAEG
jgi:hypothetical protein